MSSVLSDSLSGAVALVTGGRGQIGQAICAALAAAGGRVVATDLADSPGEATVDAWMRHDVTAAGDWARVVGKIDEQFGRLDCLINSAGICPLGPLTGVSLEEWRRVFGVNVESMVLGLQAALPLLRSSGAGRAGGSSVVNMSSVAGIRGAPFGTAYCASKGAVTLLTKSVAKEFAVLKYPVRVNSVHPGTVDSPMMDINLQRLVEVGAAPSIEIARSGFTSKNPMGRMARAEEVAGAVAFLCSPAAGFMTGSEMVIDGGSSA